MTSSISELKARLVKFFIVIIVLFNFMLKINCIDKYCYNVLSCLLFKSLDVF